MTEVAIQEDVADVDESETRVTDIELELDAPLPAEPEVKSDRDTIVDTINKRRREELEEEIGEPVSSDEDEEDDDVPAADDEPAEDVKPDEAATVTVKIDGKETTVSAQEIAEYQKNRAADKRLEEAAERRKELERREAELERREAELAGKAVEPAKAEKPAKSSMSDKEIAEKLISTVFSEDAEAVGDVIRELRAGAGSQPVTEIDIDAAVERKLAADRAANARAEMLSAVKRFDDEYAELSSNPMLRGAVDQQTIIERKNDPKATTWQLLDRAAKAVKRVMLPSVEDANGSLIEGQDAKKQKKKAAAKPVRATVSKTAPTNPGNAKPKLSAFEQIKKSRGQ